jgi:hypothetical protein
MAPPTTHSHADSPHAAWHPPSPTPEETAMTAIHEQLVRDHVEQRIRDARRADRVKLARLAGRRR